MNNKHRSTLEAVFSKLTPSALEWSSIEALLVASGCVEIDGRGSRLRFAHGTHAASFHRPLPAREARRTIRWFSKF